MSDPVKCDRCGAKGRRRMGQIAPEGWLYAEVDDGSGQTLVLYACSEKCATVEWNQGPGRLEIPGLDAMFLDVLTRDEKDEWHEHTFRVREGDRILLGSAEVMVGPRTLVLKEP